MLRSISGISEVLQQHCGVIFRCAFILYIKQRSYFWVYRRLCCKTAGTHPVRRMRFAKLREGFRRAGSHVAKLRGRFRHAECVPAVLLQLKKFAKLFPQILRLIMSYFFVVRCNAKL